jgi:DNA-binding XRE family transcriptional regulator
MAVRLGEKETSKRWIEALIFVKNELDKGKCTSVDKLIRDSQITHRWSSFLKKKNIVFIENDVFKWNPKIPISQKLVDSFRVEQKLINDKYDTSTKSNKKDVKKIRESKITNVIIQEEKVGLIRRFLKWIY